MMRKVVTLLLLATAMSVHAQQDPLSTNRGKASYAIGLNFAQVLKSEGIDVDIEALTMAIQDLLADRPLRISMEELQAGVLAYQAEQQEAKNAVAARNKEAGMAYLSSNRQKDGVVELESGLQYRVVEPGNGPSPSADDTVLVHYRGTLVNGEEFDSSYSRGAPTSLQVSQVIPGWREALALMSPGAKWEIVVPSDLGYGDTGAGTTIGPNETLIFDIELIEIQ